MLSFAAHFCSQCLSVKAIFALERRSSRLHLQRTVLTATLAASALF